MQEYYRGGGGEVLDICLGRMCGQVTQTLTLFKTKIDDCPPLFKDRFLLLTFRIHPVNYSLMESPLRPHKGVPLYLGNITTANSGLTSVKQLDLGLLLLNGYHTSY